MYGHFLEHKVPCRPVDPKLGNLVEVIRTEEKGSDVSLAMHMVNVAHKDKFDCAAVVSNDSDLAEAMRIGKDECEKVWDYSHLEEIVHQSNLCNIQIFKERFVEPILERAQLPNPIPGIKSHKPRGW